VTSSTFFLNTEATHSYTSLVSRLLCWTNK